MKKLAFPLLLIVLLAAGGYWYWTGTPIYSLQRVKAAFKAGDVAEFEEYVDVESVAQAVVDDVLGIPNEPLEKLGIVGDLISVGLDIVFRDNLVEMLKAQIIKAVRTNGRYIDLNAIGQADSILPVAIAQERYEPLAPFRDPKLGVSLKNLAKNIGFSGKTYRGVDYERIHENTAFVGLKFFNTRYEKTFTLEIKMRRSRSHWCVTQLSNLRDLINEIVQLELERLQYRRTENRPFRYDIRSLAAIF